jgi:H+/Cl- antiporter ClcA
MTGGTGNAADQMRTRQYRQLVMFAVLLGVPIAIVAYFFLVLLNNLEHWIYVSIPHAIGLGTTPRWWPLLPLLLAGLGVGLIARYVPGRGGPAPVEGLHAGSLITGPELLGIAGAAVLSVGFGPVIGPEGPLMAIGGGLALVLLRLAHREVPERGARLVSTAGSFAAISTLLGSPLIAAVFLLEASGLGGATATVMLIPGLLAAGIGALVFTGLGSLTGLTPLALSAGTPPASPTPTVGQLCWAVVIGLLAPLLVYGVRHGATQLLPWVERFPVSATAAVGVAIAVLAGLYAVITGYDVLDVLFSGQSALPGLLSTGPSFPVHVLLLLFLTKAVAYTASMAAFRGGPIFPSVFLGAAGGILLSHLPGLPSTTGAAIGAAATTTAMLRLPISGVLLVTLLLGASATNAMPLTIVAAVVAYLVINRIDPVKPHPADHVATGTEAGGAVARDEH